MKLSEKIIKLRKEKGWSQEELANQLNISRQAVSRWENESALPDAHNILQLSKLFHVSADYLLRDDYAGGSGLPEEKTVDETVTEKAKVRKKSRMVAVIASAIAASIWLGLAIDEMSTTYAFLAVANAALSAVNLFLYAKNK